MAASRDRALDGLRGVAALVVLTSHLVVASVPSMAEATRSAQTADMPALEWLFTYTPLHITWAGIEAVSVFFVLSGYVLALPAARGAAFRARSYYPQRLVRLYVPVWAALCIAGAVHVAIGGAGPGHTWWVQAHTQDITTDALRDSFLLLDGAGNFSLLGILWSLHWEVLFSLLLPLFLLAGGATRRVPVLAGALALVALYSAQTDTWAAYLPAFALGTVMAYRHESIMALRGRAVEPLLLLGAVVGLTARWWLRVEDYAITGGNAHIGGRVASVLIALGACAAVGVALVGPRARRLLQSRPIAWSGARSFSIYLVQEPIVVALSFGLGGPGLALLAAVALPCVLLAGEAFYRAIERPSHRLSRRAGRL